MTIVTTKVTFVFSLQRSKTLQEELKKKGASLADSQQQLQRCEQDLSALKASVDAVTQEGKTQRAELEKKTQSLAADLQKVQQEKEAQRKELVTVQENLGKTKKMLKESQSQLEAERKSHQSVMEEKVGLNYCQDRKYCFSPVGLIGTLWCKNGSENSLKISAYLHF